MFRLIALISCLFSVATNTFADCAKVDPKVKDENGVPMCPDVVKQTSAFAIFSCAMKQAKSWHEPTQTEIKQTREMIGAMKIRDYPLMQYAADKIGLQACRVIDGEDKYILIFAKPGVKNYNGTFYAYRDAQKVSNITIIAPHVLTDGYHSAAPLGFQKTSARWLIQNGHHKGLGGGRISDFSHSKKTLGYNAVKAVNAAFPKQIVLHIHGQSNPKSVLYRPLESAVAKPYENAIRKLTNIKIFNGFNAYYEIDPPHSTIPGRYVKTEIPVRIYKNNANIVAGIVKEFEKLDFAWDVNVPVPEISPEPEPAGEEGPEHGDDDQAPAEEEEEAGGVIETPDTAEEEPAEVEPTPSPSPLITWKPRQRPNLGDQDLICVAIKYTSGPSADLARCLQTAKNVAGFWNRLANGKKRLIAKAIEYQFDGPANHTNANKVHAEIRKKYPKALFIVPNLFAKGSSHAGMRVAVLNNAGYANGNHEVGHLLTLQHCGAWRPDPKTGKEVYNQYAGGGCIMSRYFSNAYIAPNQFIYLGWYDKSQYAIKTTHEAETYELRPIANLKAPGLAAVAIAPKLLGQERPGYIGLPPNCQDKNKQCVAYYLGNAGSNIKPWEGSARVAMFGNEYSDPETGLKITVLSRANGKVKLKVEIEPVEVKADVQ